MLRNSFGNSVLLCLVRTPLLVTAAGFQFSIRYSDLMSIFNIDMPSDYINEPEAFWKTIDEIEEARKYHERTREYYEETRKQTAKDIQEQAGDAQESQNAAKDAVEKLESLRDVVRKAFKSENFGQVLAHYWEGDAHDRRTRQRSIRLMIYKFARANGCRCVLSGPNLFIEGKEHDSKTFNGVKYEAYFRQQANDNPEEASSPTDPARALNKGDDGVILNRDDDGAILNEDVCFKNVIVRNIDMKNEWKELFALIGMLLQGDHAIPIIIDGKGSFDFKEAFSLANKSGQVRGLTNIINVDAFMENSELVNALMPYVELVELVFVENLHYYSKVLDFVKRIVPNRVIVTLGGKTVLFWDEIFDALKDTDIEELHLASDVSDYKVKKFVLEHEDSMHKDPKNYNGSTDDPVNYNRRSEELMALLRYDAASLVLGDISSELMKEFVRGLKDSKKSVNMLRIVHHDFDLEVAEILGQMPIETLIMDFSAKEDGIESNTAVPDDDRNESTDSNVDENTRKDGHCTSPIGQRIQFFESIVKSESIANFLAIAKGDTGCLAHYRDALDRAIKMDGSRRFSRRLLVTFDEPIATAGGPSL